MINAFENQYWNEGYDAYFDLFNKDDNPYVDSDPTKAEYWDLGYEKAEGDADLADADDCDGDMEF